MGMREKDGQKEREGRSRGDGDRLFFLSLVVSIGVYSRLVAIPIVVVDRIIAILY